MQQPFRMVSPWMENEDILTFLKRHPRKNPFELVSARKLSKNPQAYCDGTQLVDITNGLQYLHDHDFVHGDLKGVRHIDANLYGLELTHFLLG